MFGTLISIAIGGAFGALSRYGLGLLVSSSAVMPLWMATLGVNIIGCSLMGFMAAFLLSYPHLSDQLRPLIMIGFLGGLTTFSSFALDSYTLLDKGQFASLFFYLISSFALSLLGFFMVYSLTKSLLGQG